MTALRRSAASLISLCFGAALLMGQAQTGSISGTVVDTNKAAIAGASVEASSADTGVTLKTVSSDSGVYVFPNVPTGIWTVTAEKPGFKKLVRNQIQVFIAQRQALDLQLEIGDVKQTIEVTVNQTLLDSETSERGQTLTPKMYR